MTTHDDDATFMGPCGKCGAMIEHSRARWDSGAHDRCEGCCGYPFCSCKVSHTGDCTPETMAAKGEWEKWR